LADLFPPENVIYIGKWGKPLLPVRLEKEDAMWIVYLVVALVGLVFGVLSLSSLETEA
jgi:hypothetical protein